VKDFPITERVLFRVGVSFYNLFNHANLDQPVNDIANTDQFG
jgi:hypothetical protein